MPLQCHPGKVCTPFLMPNHLLLYPKLWLSTPTCCTSLPLLSRLNGKVPRYLNLKKVSPIDQVVVMVVVLRNYFPLMVTHYCSLYCNTFGGVIFESLHLPPQYYLYIPAAVIPVPIPRTHFHLTISHPHDHHLNLSLKLSYPLVFMRLFSFALTI